MCDPNFYRAAVVQQGPSPKFEIATLPIPEIGPMDLLIKLSVSGICGTDIALASGKLGKCCAVLGHEGVGRVVKIGANVDPFRVKIGDRVGLSWVRDVCGSCEFFLIDDTRCIQQIHSGRAVDGTLAQYAVVPFSRIIRLPEGPPDALLAPILCAGVTAYKSIKICGATPGKWIAIIGAAGGVGAISIQYAHSMGYRVLAIDVGKQKIQYCRELQAEACLDISDHENMLAAVQETIGQAGVAATLVTAGAAVAYQTGLDILGPFGTLVCVGIPPPTGQVHFHPLQFIDRGIRIIGSMVGSKGDIAEAMSFVENGKVVPRVQLVKLTDLPKIMPTIGSSELLTKFVVRLDSEDT